MLAVAVDEQHRAEARMIEAASSAASLPKLRDSETTCTSTPVAGNCAATRMVASVLPSST